MTTIIDRVIKNTGVIILGNVATAVIGLATSIPFVRYLGAAEFGVYSFVFAYVVFFTVIADFGISSIIVREIARDATRAGQLIGNAILMRLLLSAVAVAFACLVISFLPYPLATRKLACLASMGLVLSVWNVYRLIFQIHLRMEYAAVIDLVVSLLRCAAVLSLIAAKAGLVWFVAAEVAVHLPQLVANRWFSARFIKPVFAVNFSLWKTLLQEAWPLALSSVFIIIYVRIDQLMLFQMRGAADLGFYSIAVRLSEVFAVIPAAFMTSVYPLFSRYFIASPRTLTEAYRLSAKAMMLIIMPVAAGITLYSRTIVGMFYTDAFLPSAAALVVLIWAEVFVFAGVVNNRLLVSINKQRIDFVFTGTAAALNVGLNLLLIPRWGFLGACWATLAAYAVGPVMNCFLPAMRSYGLIMFRQMVKPLCASLLMAGCIKVLPETNLAASIIVGALVYCGALLCIRGVRLQEIRLLIKPEGA